MFTGLVEGLGCVTALAPEADGLRITITAPAAMLTENALDRPRIGDSVAINGCCLTIIEIANERAWSFQAGAETLSKTSLRQLALGDPINLERALPAHGRLGGHFVQGHVDGVGRVNEIRRNADWVDMWFEVPPALTALMVPKGSIAIDGVSLTLVHVEAERCGVSLIPHTLAMTTLGGRHVGDAVNVETDILGKYVQKLFAEQIASRLHEKPHAG